MAVLVVALTNNTCYFHMCIVSQSFTTLVLLVIFFDCCWPQLVGIYGFIQDKQCMTSFNPTTKVCSKCLKMLLI